jgi:DNA polymerase III delta prime subunit
MNRQLPLIEKYRPSKLSDIKNQDDIKDIFINMVQNRNVPHMILYGGAGTGKTSTAIAMCKELYKETYADNVLELNASDERGIRVVREKIKTFSQKSADSDFKVIILDEADAMTSDSQFALRRIVEKFSSNTRFILICNYINKIIPPLLSRCAVFRFKTMTNLNIEDILFTIMKKEKITITDDLKHKIIKDDLRKSINNLQKLIFLNRKEKNAEDDKTVIRYFDDDIDLDLKEIIYNDKLNTIEFTTELINEGYSFEEIYLILKKEILTNQDISNEDKAKIFMEMCRSYDKIVNGASELININHVINIINKL